MTDELKPCPFCGGEAETCSYYFEEKDMTVWQVRCKERPYEVEHPCYTADSFISFTTEAEAVEAWNTRAERTCRYEHIEGTWYKTSCVKLYDGVVPPNYCPNCGAKVVE